MSTANSFQEVSINKVETYRDNGLHACCLTSASEQLPAFSLETDYFLCLLSADFTRIAQGDLVRLVSSLLDEGACYFICHGKGAEQAHDVIDDILLADERFSSEEAIVMTAWLSDEPFAQAMLFLTCHANPSSKYLELEPVPAKLAILID